MAEADQRHAEIMIKDAGLQVDSKGVVTLGSKMMRSMTRSYPRACNEVQGKRGASKLLGSRSLGHLVRRQGA